MIISAIVCEYNPFHNGHRYHIEQTRKQTGCDAVIGIMSGNFVQRGDTALFDKYLRAKCALQNGMDLILELPAVHTLQSAELYARNAMTIVSALKCVNFLSFGSECADLNLLNHVAQALAYEDEAFSSSLKASLSDGLVFPVARARAIAEMLGQEAADVLSAPNNILAIEYLKALKRLGSPVQPCVIPRMGVPHDSAHISGGFTSASNIRSLFSTQMEDKGCAYMPDNCLDLLKYAPRSDIRLLEKAVISSVCTKPLASLRETADVTEGLEHKIKKAAMETDSLEALIRKIKSKRYTHSRIRRIILNAFLGITKADQQQTPQYIKILDFNETGQAVLNQCKKRSALPLAKNRNQIKGNIISEEIWDRELVFDRLFRLSLLKA